jgi:CheY-like chemotaxis protein
MKELWERLAYDPQTHNFTTNFLLVVFSAILTLGTTLIATISKSARDWLRTLFGRIRLTPQARVEYKWAAPSIQALKLQSKVLIVDDDAELPHFTQLKNRHFSLTIWKEVERKQFESVDQDFDLMLLDVRGVKDSFGATNGLEALELIRRDNPWIPIAVYTAYLGDISASQRDAMNTFVQHELDKLVKYHEFEEAVVSLIQRGRSRAYFVTILSQLGVDNPDDVLSRLESASGETLPVWKFVDTVTPSPFQPDQVRHVLKIAAAIYTGERWTKKRK